MSETMSETSKQQLYITYGWLKGKDAPPFVLKPLEDLLFPAVIQSNIAIPVEINPNAAISNPPIGSASPGFLR